MKKLLLFVAILTISYSQAQNILIVDNNVNVDTSPSHMHSTFASAIAAAANGDIIYVQPSITSYGNATINKEITIYGNGHTPELNAGRRALFASISAASSNFKISGIQANSITFSGTRSNAVIENNKLETIAMNSAITDNITIQGNSIGTGVYMHGSNANSTNITITHNFFDTITVNGFQYFNSTTIFNNNIVVFAGVTTQSYFFTPTDLVAQNNIFVFTSNFNGTNWQNAGTPTIFNNCLSYSYLGTTLGLLNGTGNYDNTNPQFVSIPGTNPIFNVDNDYNMSSGSSGTDGNDIGLFNGFYDFDMRGYPTLLPYLEEMTISNNMVSAGENLTVNLKANANKSN